MNSSVTRRRARRWPWLLLCSLLACSVGPLDVRVAWAQTRPSEAEARTQFERGVALLDQQRFAEAISALEASQRLRPSPAVTYNLALALRGVGRMQASIAEFERYLAQPSRSATPEELAQIRGIVAELRRSLVTLELRVSPGDAMVRIDGAAPQRMTGSLMLDPGAHSVEVTAPTYLSASRSVTLAHGSRTALEITLEPTPAVGTLTVDPVPSSAIVYVDGQRAGSGTTTRVVSSGEHSVRVECSDCASVSRTVRVDRGQNIRLHLDVTRRGGVAPWVVGVSVGAGVAAVTAAAVVTAVVLSNSGDGLYNGSLAGTWGGNHTFKRSAR